MPLSAKLDSVSVFCVMCHSCIASKLKLKMILLQNSWCFLIPATHKSLSVSNKRRKFNRNVVWLQSCVNNEALGANVGSRHELHTFQAFVVGVFATYNTFFLSWSAFKVSYNFYLKNWTAHNLESQNLEIYYHKKM